MIANHSDKYRYRLTLDLQLFAEEPGGDPGGGAPPAADPLSQPPGAAAPPAASDPPGQPSTPPGEPPKGIKVNYLGEEKYVPEEEAPNWIQKGMNHDRLQEKLKGVETRVQYLDRIAKYYGHENFDSFQSHFEAAESDRQVKEAAKRMGMDEELYRSFLEPVNKELKDTRSKLENYEQREIQREIDAEISQLKQTYGEDYTKREKEILDFAIKKGYSLEDSYILLTHNEQKAAIKLQGEQEALKKLKENANSTPGALGQGAEDEKYGYSNLTPAERKKFREKVLRGEAQ